MPRGVKTSDEVIAKIKGMRADGCTYDEIMKETGVTKNTVTRYTANIKREPAPAGTDTSSEKNVCENISDNILSDNSGNAKTPHLDFFNSAEEEAVMCAIVDKLDEYTRKVLDLTESIKCYERKRDMLCDLLNRNGYGDVTKIRRTEK